MHTQDMSLISEYNVNKILGISAANEAADGKSSRDCIFISKASEKKLSLC